MKNKILQLTNFIKRKANHYAEETEEQILAEEDFTKEIEKMVSKLYTYEEETTKSASSLLDELDELVMEDSKTIPIINKRLVDEEKFMNILDTLRLKVIGTNKNTSNYNIANDPEVLNAKEYSKQIKLMANDYCLDMMNKTEKILQESLKEIEENKKEF